MANSANSDSKKLQIHLVLKFGVANSNKVNTKGFKQKFSEFFQFLSSDSWRSVDRRNHLNRFSGDVKMGPVLNSLEKNRKFKT